MLDPYSRVNWQDADSTATPLNAENLNKMDSQIYSATEAVRTLENTQNMKYVFADNRSNPGAVDNCTETGTIYLVYIETPVVTHGWAYVLCLKGFPKAVQYAFTQSGFILFRRADYSNGTLGTWGDWDYIPTAAWVQQKIQEAIGGNNT